MRETLKDLVRSEHSDWYGLGPLTMAVIAGGRALTADESFARGAWTVVAVIMLLMCLFYLIWSRAQRRKADPPS